MATQDFTPIVHTTPKTGRRDFLRRFVQLTAMASLTPLALNGSPLDAGESILTSQSFPGKQAGETFPGKVPEGYILVKEADLEPIPDAPPPFGPAERTAVIDEWRARIDQAIVALESFWGYLGQARALPADQVDGLEFIEEGERCVKQVDELFCALQMADYEDLIEALTGKSCAFACTKHEIVHGSWPPDRIQVEIDGIRRNHGDEEADELQALLDQHYSQVEV